MESLSYTSGDTTRFAFCCYGQLTGLMIRRLGTFLRGLVTLFGKPTSEFLVGLLRTREKRVVVVRSKAMVVEQNAVSQSDS